MQSRSEVSRRRPLPPGFGTIWLTVAIDLVGFGIVLPILPRYAEDLHISATAIGLIVGSFSLAQLVCAPLLGRLSDRIGRKPVLLLSLAGTAIGSLLTGLAGSVWLLTLGRVVDGASGASVSVAQASVTDVAEPQQRARLLGLLGAAFGVGFVVGPALGSLAALGGPHVPFFVAAAIAGVNALIAVRRLPETHRPAAQPAPDRQVVGTVGVNGPVEPVERPRRRFRVGRLPAGVAALIAIVFIAVVAFSGFEGTFALLLDDRLGLSLSSTGVVFTVIGVVLVAVQAGAVHPVVSRLGDVGAMRAGLVLDAVGLVLVAINWGWASLAPGLVLLSVGEGLLSPSASTAVTNRVPARRRGEVLGFQQSAGSLARFVGPAAAGALYQHGGIPAPYLAGAGLVFVALGLCGRIPTGAAHRPRPVAGQEALAVDGRSASR